MEFDCDGVVKVFVRVIYIYLLRVLFDNVVFDEW